MTVRTSICGKVAALPEKLSKRLRQRGISDAIGWCLYQFGWRWREWRLGARTREFQHGVVVGDDGEFNGYEPIDYRCFDAVLDYMQPISQHDVFLDYGCGMGRAVIMAATQPFARVLGVEIDNKLAAVARQQIDRVRRRGKLACQAVEIFEADASRWKVPSDVNHIFLFNSFTGNLLQETLHQIRQSALANPRCLKIIYIQPISDEDPLSELPWLQLERELSTGYWMHVRSRVYGIDISMDAMSESDGTTTVSRV
ncbi:MAG: class I SAM-dependent methyltransferase [Candidatus Paceibacterota bacterium]